MIGYGCKQDDDCGYSDGMYATEAMYVPCDCLIVTAGGEVINSNECFGKYAVDEFGFVYETVGKHGAVEREGYAVYTNFGEEVFYCEECAVVLEVMPQTKMTRVS